MRLFKWLEGRQKGGYKKMLLWYCNEFIPFDLWLLKYPEGSKIGWHTDEVEDKKHYRVNFRLKSAKSGGKFLSRHDPIFSKWGLTVFRPDKNRHMVTKVTEGTRFVLSFGFIKD